MAIRRICDFLAGSGMPYSIATHARAYTAQEVAEASHVPGTYMAKTVIVWVDDQLAMAVIPSTRALDLDSLRSQSGRARCALPVKRNSSTSSPIVSLGRLRRLEISSA